MPLVSSRLVVAVIGFLAINHFHLGVCVAQKYTPEHPKVQEMVNRGIGFLTKAQNKRMGGIEGSAEGIALLTAYTVFKVTSESQHPQVAEGVAIAKKMARDVWSSNFIPEEKILYVISLAGMLLPTVDVDANGAETKLIRDYLLKVQKSNGGFGYLSGKNYIYGDISQTQYAMLCLWTMSQLGVEVPDEPIVRCVNFMIASQTAEGSWPYQFGDSGADGTPTNSLSAAGLSGLLIAGDSLGLYRNKLADNQEEEGIIPVAFRRVMAESQRPKVNIDRSRLDNSSKRCEAWFAANPYSRPNQMWHYYYVYSKERYESFLEITKGKQIKSPDWYNQGVEELMKVQAADGSWGTMEGDRSVLSADVCTSFAVLFLIRSTQKAIGELHEANNKGLDGIPDDVLEVNISGNKVVSKSTTTSIDDALKMMEDESKKPGEDSLSADRIVLSKDPKQRKEQLNRFVRLLSSKDYGSRRLAAKMLGRGDDLEMVPGLIYALTDPDPMVPVIAERSLRLLSRQLDTAYLPNKEKLSDQEKAKAAIQWKKWYANVRPEYIFVD